jgi:hypothetical protein
MGVGRRGARRLRQDCGPRSEGKGRVPTGRGSQCLRKSDTWKEVGIGEQLRGRVNGG